MNEQKNNNPLMPLAIVVAGLAIAGAVIFSNNNGAGAPAAVGGINVADAPTQKAPAPSGDLSVLREVSSDDHIKGNLDAPVKIIEYSDFECPFCQRVHPTIESLVKEYDGKVAWVYRHFPLNSIHSEAMPRAVGSECVAELGGNDAFWRYTDGIYGQASISKGNVDIVAIAKKAGIDENAFNECVASGRHNQSVNDDLNEATATGGTGTPYSIIVGPNGETLVLSGAQQLPAWKQAIDQLLK